MKSKLLKQKEQVEVAQPVAAARLDIESVLREKYSDAPPVAAVRSAPPPPLQSQVVLPAEPPRPLERRPRDVVRVSVDFPRPLYEAVVLESDEQAQTMREFMLTLVRQYFERKRRGEAE